ncbi:MAG: ABC transporter ATP-binding protein [Archangium gephyra]|uniref:ABC transporter ATP-binding protein n=1 Tax=Archangium gephyra TaxID=48 RepID=A0A2W5UBM5_9BACT|nr:MAG: ABC transporter ATP-binding protein [Archangium gephyra]
MTPVVQVEGLEKTYRLGFMGRKSVRALSGVSFEVKPGEVFGLIGPNGAGKSTCIKILLNLVWPSAGKATLFGVDVREARSRVPVGYVPEMPAPYEHLTGREYLHFQAALAGLHGAEANRQVDRVIERVELQKHGHLAIRRYSKGMTQRAMLAGALLGDPRLIILDEPTSGLDPLGRKLVRELIIEQRSRGAAVLFCTHIISDVESLCDRVALVVGGKVWKSGHVQELMSTGTRNFEVVVEHQEAEGFPEVPGVVRRELLSGRAIFEVPADALQNVLQFSLTRGWKVTRVHPLQLSLEDTFVAAVKGSGQQVGGMLE